MANILADEHVALQLQSALRRLGHNVDSVRTYCENKSGDGWSDEIVVEFATQRVLAVLTSNCSDFLSIHRKNKSHAGIILCSPSSNFKGQARMIHDAIKNIGDLRGKILDCREIMDSRKSKRGGKSRVVDM